MGAVSSVTVRIIVNISELHTLYHGCQAWILVTWLMYHKAWNLGSGFWVKGRMRVLKRGKQLAFFPMFRNDLNIGHIKGKFVQIYGGSFPGILVG